MLSAPEAICARAKLWNHAELGSSLTRLRSRSRSSRMAFMVALVLFSSSSLLHSMAVRLSFSSLSPASSFSQRDLSSARLGYRSRPRTPSISSTVCKNSHKDEQSHSKSDRGENSQDRCEHQKLVHIYLTANGAQGYETPNSSKFQIQLAWAIICHSAVLRARKT